MNKNEFSKIIKWADDNNIPGGVISRNYDTLLNMKTLHLSGYKIKTLPKEIYKLVKLESFNIWYCEYLEYLPNGIGSLCNLTNCDLFELENLNKLPNDFYELKSLTHLNIENCPIKISKNICKLQLLESLGLREIVFVSHGIYELKNLDCLYLSNCNIKSIPAKIANLTKLEMFVLRFSNITKLPSQISELTNLAWLRLERTQLRCLPKDIVKLTNLNQWITINGSASFRLTKKQTSWLNWLEEHCGVWVHIYEYTSIHKTTDNE